MGLCIHKCPSTPPRSGHISMLYDVGIRVSVKSSMTCFCFTVQMRSSFSISESPPGCSDDRIDRRQTTQDIHGCLAGSQGTHGPHLWDIPKRLGKLMVPPNKKMAFDGCRNLRQKMEVHCGFQPPLLKQENKIPNMLQFCSKK